MLTISNSNSIAVAIEINLLTQLLLPLSKLAIRQSVNNKLILVVLSEMEVVVLKEY
jgi:hypothetical protein